MLFVRGMFGFYDGTLAKGVFEVSGRGFFEIDFGHCIGVSRQGP